MMDFLTDAEERSKRARAKALSPEQRDAAYQDGFKAKGERHAPMDFWAADEEWFRGYDDGHRRQGYYLVEYMGERQPAQWTGKYWLVIGDDVPHKTAGRIIGEIETYPELTGDGWC